jgi:hypothetical protein
MNMIKIICPKCGAEAKLSLVDTNYVGPRRCWKCHEYFTITIENNQVTQCEPLSVEEYEKQQAAKKAAEKMGRGIEMSSQEEPPPRPAAAQRQQEFFRPAMPKDTPRQSEPKGPPTVFPPNRFNTFIPVEEPKTEPEKKPDKPKNPPDRLNPFIPPAT